LGLKAEQNIQQNQWPACDFKDRLMEVVVHEVAKNNNIPIDKCGDVLWRQQQLTQVNGVKAQLNVVNVFLQHSVV